MVIISKTIIREFSKIHADADSALDNWYQLTADADWKNFNEMKKTFNSVDAVGNDRYVFNIKGNSYRLVALIIFKVRTLLYFLWGRIRNTIKLTPQWYHLKNRRWRRSF